MHIPVILGTARLGRQSEKAAQFMLQKAREAGLLKGNSQHGQAKRLLEELIWYARALKAGRETSGESS